MTLHRNQTTSNTHQSRYTLYHHLVVFEARDSVIPFARRRLTICLSVLLKCPGPLTITRSRELIGTIGQKGGQIMDRYVEPGPASGGDTNRVPMVPLAYVTSPIGL